MVTIAIVAMGEMGSGIARRFVDRGARVLTCVEGRSKASVARAENAGVEMLGDVALVAQADLFLSVVPPASATDMANRFLVAAKAAPRVPAFIDCNAIAPQTLHRIAAMFAAQGLHFIDGSIIGTAPKPDGSGPRLYLSGPGVDDYRIAGHYGTVSFRDAR